MSPWPRGPVLRKSLCPASDDVLFSQGWQSAVFTNPHTRQTSLTPEEAWTRGLAVGAEGASLGLNNTEFTRHC